MLELQPHVRNSVITRVLTTGMDVPTSQPEAVSHMGVTDLPCARPGDFVLRRVYRGNAELYRLTADEFKETHRRHAADRRTCNEWKGAPR